MENWVVGFVAGMWFGFALTMTTCWFVVVRRVR